jgi:hypothetical protein
MQHAQDTPCFELAKQALKDVGIPPQKQKWPTKNLNKWIRIAAAIILFGPIIVILWTFIVDLFR